MRGLVFVFLFGCNQVLGLNETDHRGADAAIDAPGCSGAQFVNPMPVPGDAFRNQPYDPSTSASPYELWYAADSGGQYDIFIATRTTDDGPFVASIPFLHNTDNFDSDPTLSADGLSLVFKSTRLGAPSAFESTRPTLDAPFGPPSQIAILSNTSVEHGIDLSFDGLTLYFVDLGEDLRAIRRPTRSAPFGAPSDVLASGVRFPSISPDGLELFFTRDVDAGIYRRTRTDPEGPFGTQDEPVNLAAVDPDISPSSRTLYLSSNGELQQMTRACP